VDLITDRVQIDEWPQGYIVLLQLAQLLLNSYLKLYFQRESFSE